MASGGLGRPSFPVPKLDGEMLTSDDRLPERKQYLKKAFYRVLCPGGFNDGNLRKAAHAEGVELPWRYGLTQTLSGSLINKMQNSGAVLEVLGVVVPPSTKSKVEEGENDKKEEGDEENTDAAEDPPKDE